MSGDWISIDIDLSDKPEVRRIARALGIDRDAVVGKLARVWGWFDRVSVDGFVDGAVDADVDDLARLDGFARAMAAVGWLLIDSELHRIGIPNFSDHHGNSAKKRLLKSARQRRYRDGLKARGADIIVDVAVDQAASTDVDACRRLHATSTEQNRREQKEEEQEPRARDELTATSAGAACKALMAAGVGHVNPSHVDLLALLAAGVTAQELVDTATELIASGKTVKLSYLCATIRGRREEAAAKGAVPTATAPASRAKRVPEGQTTTYRRDAATLTEEQRLANKSRIEDLAKNIGAAA